MNQTHLHLVITHLPIFGSFLGALVLAYGLRTKCLSTKMAAYYLLVIASLGAGIAYLTGEAAEETVEHLQTVSENVIEQHEDFASIALVALIILGVSALAGLYLTYKKSTMARPMAIAVLLWSLISFGLVARTGYLGGQIRHTEVSNSAQATPENGGESHEEE